MNPKSSKPESSDPTEPTPLRIVRSQPTNDDISKANNHWPVMSEGEIWERIGTEYLNAPPLPLDRYARHKVIEKWQTFASYVNHQLDEIYKTVTVTESDDSDPYPASEAQSADIDRGHLIISRAHCDHPIWTPEQNIAFRVWHDVTGHHAHRLGFDRFGELAVYAATCMQIPVGLRPVLFVEVLAQTAASILSGGFGDQKCYLPNTFGLLHTNTNDVTDQAWPEAA